MEMQLIVGVVFPACNYIKKETQVQAIPCEFCQFFKPKTLFETKLGHGCSLVNVDTFFSLQLYQKQDFGIGDFRKFCKIFENTNFLECLRTVTSNTATS